MSAKPAPKLNLNIDTLKSLTTQQAQSVEGAGIFTVQVCRIGTSILTYY